MKRIKNGFTLIELLICISIIAFLGIVIGINANNLFANTKKEEYQNQMRQIFDAAKVYYNLSDASCNQGKSCNITLKSLINKGLLDESYLETKNPVKESGNFLETDEVLVIFAEGEKSVEYKCSASITLKESDLDIFDNWGEC